jgi:hypothetical protein
MWGGEAAVGKGIGFCNAAGCGLVAAPTGAGATAAGAVARSVVAMEGRVDSALAEGAAVGSGLLSGSLDPRCVDTVPRAGVTDGGPGAGAPFLPADVWTATPMAPASAAPPMPIARSTGWESGFREIGRDAATAR